MADGQKITFRGEGDQEVRLAASICTALNSIWVFLGTCSRGYSFSDLLQVHFAVED